LRYIATLPILAVTLPRRVPTDGRILPQKVRISAQRKARIRANITATEKIAIEPNLAHLTQAYLARPNDNAPTLTNKSTASAWRICIRRSSGHTIASDLRLVFYSRDQWYPTVGDLPGRGFVPIIGPVYGVGVEPSAGSFKGDGFIFSSPTIWLEISETELKFMVAGRSKQLRDLSRAQGPASTPVAAQRAERANAKVAGTETFIC
jgi:hypothetical protein